MKFGFAEYSKLGDPDFMEDDAINKVCFRFKWMVIILIELQRKFIVYNYNYLHFISFEIFEK